jgi:hypothetical protein
VILVPDGTPIEKLDRLFSWNRNRAGRLVPKEVAPWLLAGGSTLLILAYITREK